MYLKKGRKLNVEILKFVIFVVFSNVISREMDSIVWYVICGFGSLWCMKVNVIRVIVIGYRVNSIGIESVMSCVKLMFVIILYVILLIIIYCL